MQRSNDDGEPSGTAGRPILEVLTGRAISDIVAVVTRWFGGTLLGAGGLVRAYSDATAAAVDQAGIRWREQFGLGQLSVPVAMAGSLEHRLRQVGDVVEVSYGPQVSFVVAHRDLGALEREIAEWTAGTARLQVLGNRWVDARPDE